MPPSLEMQQKVAEWRAKAREGTLTDDECREAIAFLRQERLMMPATKASGKSKEPAPNVNDLLSELGIKD